MKFKVLFILLLTTTVGFSQYKKIQIIHSDNTFIDEEKYPEAIVALGNVIVEHEGATLSCKQALIYQNIDIIKAFGNVIVNQGDTIIQTSKYVHYDGKTKTAKSWGNVILKDPSMTLSTDTLHFDREKQILYYKDHATIKDSINTLNSDIGKYFLKTNKFQALSRVVITNPDNTVTSEQLDYFTDTGISNLYGATTISDKDNNLYCEKGYHNSKTNISHFIKNAKIIYKDREIKGDSLYYDKNIKFASATGHVKVTDTINNSIIKGGYAEYFEAKDSIMVVKKPIVMSLIEKDSMFIHGDTLLVTGEQDRRIIRAYHHVKFFRDDLQGKCDSLYSNEEKGLTKMYRRPVLWNKQNQITGDTIHFIANTETQKIDSLKVYNKAFVIEKDSISGYNQINGKNLYAKFLNDEIDNILVNGNGQMIFYYRDEEKVLIGITKMRCSNIAFQFREGELDDIKFLVKPEGKTYPPSKFPEEESKLKGFLWREKERPLNKDAVFIHDKGDEELIKTIIIEEKKAKEELLKEKKREQIRQKSKKEMLDKKDNNAKDNKNISN